MTYFLGYASGQKMNLFFSVCFQPDFNRIFLGMLLTYFSQSDCSQSDTIHYWTCPLMNTVWIRTNKFSPSHF